VLPKQTLVPELLVPEKVFTHVGGSWDGEERQDRVIEVESMSLLGIFQKFIFKLEFVQLW
jgi:hypothetical protein